jgi:hypothetical protein
MTCDVCAYWRWRLADLELSHAKSEKGSAESLSFVQDIGNVERNLRQHQHEWHRN